MRPFAIQSMCHASSALAAGCLLFGAGCGIVRVPTHSFVAKTVLGVRYQGTNAVERIVAKEHVREYYHPLSVEPPSGYSEKRWGRTVEAERPNQKPIRCASLEALGQRAYCWNWIG